MMDAPKKMPPPKVRAFLLVVSADGRVKVDNWNALTWDEQRQIAEYYMRSERNGCDSGNGRP